ncbi:hypothetical protein NGR_c05790 [Sinorhizobium fredii NGR234]|uniref:MotA/TolQ/ExbB proton channel domain-containing protein n=1 Tax=Sinorhizobium fredii (strain NBRC 101917 / NGR234) TaxID=394 RepID=C3MI24_SINFN|nr:hypothetical protein NGR_c05790 [Sinorhizobium fredii NGR234]
MDIVFTAGIFARDLVLALASLLKQPPAPGLFSLFLVILLVIATLWFWAVVRRRVGLLRRATKLVRKSRGPEEFRERFQETYDELTSWSGADAGRLADTWDEFRETTIESQGQTGIRNAIRPSVFFNLEEMGFSVSGWRVVPSLFVSVGLAATFLGLIAALQETGNSLSAGGDQAAVMKALTQLLTVASAKFIMSLTGLLCSIVFTVVMRVRSSGLEQEMRTLTHAIETRMSFVSLEDLAEKQLKAIVEQRDHMQKLNHELIAAISEPLQKAAASGINHVDEMVQSLAGSLTQGLVGAMSATSERLEAASGRLEGLAATLSGAAQEFSQAAERTAVGLDGAARRLELVSDNLARAGNGLAQAAVPVAESANKTAEATQQIASSSINMVESARQTMSSEREMVVAAANSIREHIKSFETRAAAYDGQLAAAFRTFTEQISRSIGEVENHANNVHGQYTEALSTLQGVIENAKAFTPESARPSA